MHTLQLTGGVYTLEIQAEIGHHKWIGGNSEIGDRDCSNTYWQGQARLSIGSSDIVFNFKTRIHREISPNNIPPLEKEFMAITGISENAKIVNKEKIIEFFCEKLWHQVWDAFNNQKDQKLFFITTNPPIIDGMQFVNQGFIIEPGYQTQLVV